MSRSLLALTKGVRSCGTVIFFLAPNRPQPTLNNRTETAKTDSINREGTILYALKCLSINLRRQSYVKRRRIEKSVCIYFTSNAFFQILPGTLLIEFTMLVFLNNFGSSRCLPGK